MPTVDMISEGDAPKYEEAFPPLPQAKGPAFVSQGAPTIGQGTAIRQSIVTTVFQVPVEERRFVTSGEAQFGGRHQDAQKKICQEIAASNNVQINLDSTKDQTLSVIITGKPDDMRNAKRQLLKELQTQAQVQMHIPREYHRFILGKSGSNLKEIELTSSTKINIPRTQDASDIITISGTKEGIQVARQELDNIVSVQSKLGSENFTIPKIYHPFILGPYRKTVDELKERLKVAINVPPPTSPREDISVSGDKEPVMEAVRIIKGIYEDKSRRCNIVTIDVPKNQHRYVIGQRGVGLSDILDQTEVSVEVPPTESSSQTIILRGPGDKLGSALTMVYEKAASMKQDVVNCPAWLHRLIMGRQGCNMKTYTEGREKLHIEFITSSDTIEVEGAANDVNEVVKLLQENVAELQRTLDIAELHVENKHHKHVIGKGGCNISRLQDENSVSILISSDSSDNIRIFGDPKGVENAKTEILAMVAKKDNEKSKDLLIDQKYHRQLIGANGSRIREIRDRYPDVNINFPDHNAGSDLISLRGPRQAVDAVATQLTKTYNGLVETSYVREVRVLKQFHKNVIGKGGSTIRKIREESGVNIELPNERADCDVIRITGRKQGVDEAVHKIEAIQAGLQNVKEVVVPIPARLRASLIGTKGRVLSALQAEVGGNVQINFPPSRADSADNVTIRGDPEEVDRAKKLLLELAQQKEELSHQETVRAKANLHKFLIGKRGANIEQIRKSTGARVIFPDRDDEDANVIQIVGSKVACAKAKAELEAKIKDLENSIEEVVTIAPKWHRHFLQRGTQVLDELSRDFGGVSVSFPKMNTPLPEGEKVRIMGPKDCVKAGIKRIEEIVEELESQVTLDVVIPAEHHPSLIGRNGEQVRNLQKDYSVAIKFPERRRQPAGANFRRRGEADPAPSNGHENGDADSESSSEEAASNNDGAAAPMASPDSIIQVTGRKDNCEAAKEALLALVPVSEDIHLANEFHRNLIGQRGQVVQDIMKRCNVNIIVPDAKKGIDYITVRGVRSRIDQLKELLDEKVIQWEKDKADQIARSFEVHVDVPVKYHRQIIGQRGATINELRDRFDVNIQMPDVQTNGEEGTVEEEETSNAERITVRGYQEKAEKAKEEILALVEKLKAMVEEELVIPNEVHSRLIGGRGRAIRKFMDDFHVTVTFPGREAQAGAKNVVVVSGDRDAVDAACDDIVTRANEMMEEIVEHDQLSNLSKAPSTRKMEQTSGKDRKEPGYVVSGAPWQANGGRGEAPPDTSNAEDFPSFGAAENSAPGGGLGAWARGGQRK